jgi:hypothetical protein
VRVRASFMTVATPKSPATQRRRDGVCAGVLQRVRARYKPHTHTHTDGDVEVLRHEDIAGLEVAVDNLLAVHKRQRLHHLAKPLFQDLLGQRLLLGPLLLQHVLQVACHMGEERWREPVREERDRERKSVRFE